MVDVGDSHFIKIMIKENFFKWNLIKKEKAIRNNYLSIVNYKILLKIGFFFAIRVYSHYD